MKLMINYDFFNAIRNVNEPFGPLKIIRNEKVKYSAFFPIWYLIGNMFNEDFQSNMLSICFSYGIVMSMDLLTGSILKFDKYENISSMNLKKLVPRLADINIKTDYELLRQSELYQKQYKVELDENKIPFLMENKYILVPTYSYSGEIVDTSILQEHEIGTKTYTLSMGEPEKRYRAVMSHA